MPRRKELRGGAFGLLGSFVSRNNDVGGYWALGKLYEHAMKANARDVSIDLSAMTITPPNTEFREMVNTFRQRLVRQLLARKLPAEWVGGAVIRVAFSRTKSLDKAGDVFDCTVALTDDKGRTHDARTSGACWLHDPMRESRSTRA
jgi:hypothetical protein